MLFSGYSHSFDKRIKLKTFISPMDRGFIFNRDSSKHLHYNPKLQK